MRQIELDGLFQNLNESMPFEGKQRVWERVTSETRKERRPARPALRLLLTAACLLLLPLVVFSAERIRLIADRIAAEHSPEIFSQFDGASLSTQFQFVNHEYLSLTLDDIRTAEDGAHIRFETLEEAQAALPFPIRFPAYAAEDYTYSHCSIFQFGSGAYDESVAVYFRSPSGHTVYGYTQYYVGEACEVEISTTGGMEVLDLGGRLVYLGTSGEDSPVYQLVFLDGIYAFEVFSHMRETVVETALSLLEG